MPRFDRILLVCVALSTAFGGSASAQGRVMRLDFSGAEGCPDAGQFADEVSARVGRIAFDADASDVATVRMGWSDGWATVTAVTRERTTTSNLEHTRMFRDPSCAVAAEAAAAALAVWLEEPRALMGVSVGTPAPTPTPEPPAPPRPNGVLLRVTGDFEQESEHGWAFHIETNTGVGTGSARFFERLCLLPCETRLRPGLHQFGIAPGNGIASPFEQLTQIDVDSELHIAQRDAGVVARIGGVFMAVGLLGILSTPSIWLVGALNDKDRLGRVGMAGTLASLALFIGGIVMLRRGDNGGVEVTVRPL